MAEEVKLEDTLNKRWKDDKTGFGYKMLQKMGWKEEKGLGKNEDGIANSIKVKKRDATLGLGVQKDEAGNHGWGSTVNSFNQVLNILNEQYGEENKKQKKSKKKKSANIQVSIKYKKLSAAKDLSTKSAQELASVLGTKPSVQQSTIDDNNDNSDDHEKIKKKSSKRKRKNSE